MKRMHIGLRVEDLDASVDFYTRLFDQEPSLVRPGYAKWMLDDPFVNFAINTTACDDPGPPGVSHLGIQVTSNEELDEVRRQWDARGFARADQDDLVCGYQRQDKSWVADPQDMPWEVFVTHGLEDAYGTNEMPDLG